MFSCHQSQGAMDNEPLCKALQALKDEHSPLNLKKKALFDEATSIIDETSKDKKIDKLHSLRTHVEQFSQILEPHSEKEEGHLFEMMATYIGRNQGPIAVMEMEHEEAKRLITLFLQNTEPPFDHENAAFVDENCNHVIGAFHVLTSHFSKEEQVLFPMAETMLTEQQKAELLENITSA